MLSLINSVGKQIRSTIMDIIESSYKVFSIELKKTFNEFSLTLHYIHSTSDIFQKLYNLK